MGLIRLLLALSVVVTHCGEIFGLGLVDGHVAVESFYIISGFYMSLILNEKYVGVNGSYKLFITNRFIRLYPLYWVVLILSLFRSAAIVIATHGNSLSLFKHYLAIDANLFTIGYLILTQIIIFGQDFAMFLGVTHQTGSLYFTTNFWDSPTPVYQFLFIPQAWSLGLELTFYLMAPLVLKKGLPLVLAIISVSLILRFYIYNNLHLSFDPWTYRFFPTELIFFLLGYVSYRLMVRNISLTRFMNISVFISVILFTLAYKFFPATKITYIPFSIKEILYLSSIVLTIPILFNYLKRNRLDTAIGELSYPVYIIHFLVFWSCGDLPLTLLHSGSAVAVISIVGAYVLNQAISKPIEKFRQSRLRNVRTEVAPVIR